VELSLERLVWLVVVELSLDAELALEAELTLVVELELGLDALLDELTEV